MGPNNSPISWTNPVFERWRTNCGQIAFSVTSVPCFFAYLKSGHHHHLHHLASCQPNYPRRGFTDNWFLSRLSTSFSGIISSSHSPLSTHDKMWRVQIDCHIYFTTIKIQHHEKLFCSQFQNHFTERRGRENVSTSFYLRRERGPEQELWRDSCWGSCCKERWNDPLEPVPPSTMHFLRHRKMSKRKLLSIQPQCSTSSADEY